MSKEPQPKKDEKYEGLDIAIWSLTTDYEEVWVPTAIVPLSLRAIELFKSWGWDPEESIGLRPPLDAMELINAIPSHWIVRREEPQEDRYFVQEITLPASGNVVH